MKPGSCEPSRVIAVRDRPKIDKSPFVAKRVRPDGWLYWRVE